MVTECKGKCAMLGGCVGFRDKYCPAAPTNGFGADRCCQYYTSADDFFAPRNKYYTVNAHGIIGGEATSRDAESAPPPSSSVGPDDYFFVGPDDSFKSSEQQRQQPNLSSPSSSSGAPLSFDDGGAEVDMSIAAVVGAHAVLLSLGAPLQPGRSAAHTSMHMHQSHTRS